jgi:hypothetical protein
MIGGPDLAVVNVEPDEFLRFVSGDLGEMFIDTPAGLQGRVETLRVRPDPDGRHRVDELFCYDDTWRLTVVALLERSHAVLMDLRGVSGRATRDASTRSRCSKRSGRWGGP